MVDKIFMCETDGEIPFLFDTADSNVPILALGDGFLFIISDNAAETADRIEVSALSGPTAAPDQGWVEKRFVGDEARPGALLAHLNAFNEKLFVQECCTYELKARAGGPAADFAIAADYLIALALITTKLKDIRAEADADPTGPYAIKPARWQAFLAANPEGGWTRLDRFFPLLQIPCAAWEAQRAFTAFSEKATAANMLADDQPYIPSFLNLLQAWILGVEPAWNVDMAHLNGEEQRTVQEVAGVDDATFAEMVAAAKPILPLAPDTTVDRFVDLTAEALNKAFKSAFSKIRTHAPDFAATPDGPAPWYPVAETEKTGWDGLVESDANGRQKVITYFQSLYPGQNFDGTLAWCGAFAGHCLINSGNEAAASSLPDVAERAANWKGWGDRTIRLGAKIPKGAIVVLHPSPGTNSSGHVCFFDHVVSDRKIACLGGNQGDTCRVSTYPVSRIVAIRWLDVVPATTGAQAKAAAVAGADLAGGDGDAQVVAQTIWGEARGESDEGREAVASVIANRVAAGRPHFGEGFRGVCMKPWQFSCWNPDDPNLQLMVRPDTLASDLFQQCLAIAQAAVAGTLADRTGGALHYFAKTIAKPAWASAPGAQESARIGNHIFYTGVA